MQITNTIKLCNNYNTTYLLPDLYLLLANISKFFKDNQIAIDYLEKASFLYKIDDNHQMLLAVEHYIQNLS